MNYNHAILDEPATALAINVEDIPYYKTAQSSKVFNIDLNNKDQNGLTLFYCVCDTTR